MQDKEKNTCECMEENNHSCGCGLEETEESCGCGCEETEESCGCGCEDTEESCGCGCGEECDSELEEEEGLVVELEDEDGEIVACNVVDGFNYKDNDYVLVENPKDSSVYLFKVVGEDEDSQLVVPEDEEFDEVSSYYESLLEE